MDDLIGDDEGGDLLSGPAGADLLHLVGNESVTSPLVAATFWQAYLNRLEIRDEPWAPLLEPGRADILVVRHGRGWSRQSLLFLTHDKGDFEPQTYRATPQSYDLHEGWEEFSRNIVSSARRLGSGSLADPVIRELLTRGGDLAAEALEQENFGIVVAPAPETVRTAYLPERPMSIHAVESASIGVFATDLHGRTGFTTVHHAFDDTMRRSVIGSLARLGDAHYTVVSDDFISDSCFVEVPGALPKGRSCAGVMMGTLPPLYSELTFHGVSSGVTKTRFLAHTYELPFWRPGFSPVSSQQPILRMAILALR